MNFAQPFYRIFLFKKFLPFDRVQGQNFGESIANPVRVFIITLNRIIQRAGFWDDVLEYSGQDPQFGR